MNRTSIALVLLGLGTAACAQSSVTLYGVTDANLSRGIGSLGSKTFLGSGANMTSRVGFRGVEDLGGGLSAGFNLEAQVFMDTGEGQPTNTNNQATGATAGAGLTFARRATVSLLGGWGELRLGRDFTAHYRNRVEVDPFGNAGVGAIQPFAGSLGGPVSTRASNMLGYFLPAGLGGFYGQAQVYLGENASNAPGSDAGTGQTMRVGYNNGRLNLSLAAGHTNYLATAAAGDIDSVNLGVQYAFGPVRVMGGLYRDTVERTVGKLVGKGWTVGALWNTGPGEVKAALSGYGTNAAGRPETRKLSLGYVHNLSKRTAVYGTLARVSNSGGASAALNQSVTAANASSTGFDLGVRHSF